MNDWLINIIFLIVGGTISIVSSIGIDLIRNRRKRKIVRQAILTEIESNIKSAGNVDLYKSMWSDDIFRNNYDNLDAFSASELNGILRFYLMINKFKERVEYHDKLWLENEQQRESHMEKFNDSLRVCLNLGKEINSYGEEIIKNIK